VKTDFTQLAGDTSLQQAEAKLLAAGSEGVTRAAAQLSH
jgi:hypothetical protein